MENETLRYRFVFSCRKATALMDKRSAMELSLKEKLQLKFHLSICKGCRAYEKQSVILQQILTQFTQKNALAEVEQLLNNELKINIIKKIQEKK